MVGLRETIKRILNPDNRWGAGFIVVMFLVVLGISARQSIWLDEGLSIFFAQKSISELVRISMTTDLHPPLYNLWLHVSGALLSKHIWAYRLWSTLAYAAAAAILFVFSKKYVTDVRQRLLYLGFFLLSPFALFYAGESRSYMIVVLVSLIQFVSFDAVCKGGSRGHMLAYTISSIVGVYLFYPIIFLMVGEFAYVVVCERKQFKKFLVPWIITGVSYVPWIYAVLIHRLGENPGHFLHIPWWQIPAVIFVGFSGGRVAVTDLNHIHDYWPTILVSAAAALQCIGFLWWKRIPDRQGFYRLLVVLLVPVLICLTISFFRFPIFDPRYYAEVFPLFILFLIVGNSTLTQVQPKLGLYGAFILLAANLVINGLYVFNPWYEREPWKKVVPMVEAELTPADAVVFIGNFQPPPTYSMYQTKPADIVGAYPDDIADIQDMATIEKHLQTELGDNSRIWYSQFLEWQKDPEHKIRAIIEKEFVYKKTVGFFKVEFDLYERR